MKGTVQPTSFVFQGQARARLMGLELPGEGLVSNVGVAACVPVKVSGTVKNAQVFRVGFGFRFRHRAARPDERQLRRRAVEPDPARRQGRQRRPARRRTRPSPRSTCAHALPGMVLAIEGASAPPT